MKISEIHVNQSREEPITKFEHLFGKSTPTVATHTSDLMFVYAPETSYSDEAFGLQTKEGELVAIITVDHERIGACQISQTLTLPAWRRKGCIRYLINQITKKHKRVYSDTNQTPEAREMWHAFAHHTGGSMNVGVYDPDTGEEFPATLENVSSVYNSEKLLYAERKKNAMDESSHPRNLHMRRKNINRDYDSLWYFVPWENNP